jgi:hypothetical protein
MAQGPLWTDNVIWSNNGYTWDGFIEIVAVRDRGVGFARVINRLKKKQPKKYTPRIVEPVYDYDEDKVISKDEEEPETIRLICRVADLVFDHANYINKNLKVELLESEYVITEVRKAKVNLSVKPVNLTLEHVGKDRIKINAKNVVIK